MWHRSRPELALGHGRAGLLRGPIRGNERGANPMTTITSPTASIPVERTSRVRPSLLCALAATIAYGLAVAVGARFEAERALLVASLAMAVPRLMCVPIE